MSNVHRFLPKLTLNRRFAIDLLDGVGVTAPPRTHTLEFLAAVAPQLPLFHRLMELCNKNEMNGLCAEYTGLYRLAKTMERVAASIRSGAILVRR